MKVSAIFTLRAAACAVVACAFASCQGGSDTTAKRVVKYPTVDQMLAIDAEYGLNKVPVKKRSSRPLTTDINTGTPPAVYDPGYTSYEGPLAPLPPINIPDTPAPARETTLPEVQPTTTPIDLPPSPTITPPADTTIPVTPVDSPATGASSTLTASPLSEIGTLPSDSAKPE